MTLFQALALASSIVGLYSSAFAAAPDQLDGSFGEGGEAVFQANPECRRGCVEFAGSYARALLLEASGKVVLGGANVHLSSPGERTPSSLLRLQANGALDPTFGDAGQASSPPFTIERLAKLPNGDLLAAGSGPAGIGMERYTADGVPDEAFTPGGVRWLHPPPAPRDIAIDRAGRVLLMTERTPNVLEAMRFSLSGALDASFGFHGIVRLYEVPEAKPTAIAPAPDGGVVLAGSVPVQGTSESRLLVARLLPSGRLDRVFGGHGFAITQPIGGAAPTVVAVDRDKRVLVVAGDNIHGPSSRGRLLLWRYTPRGQPDSSFGKHGVASDTVFSGEGFGARSGSVVPSAIAFDAADDPVVAGSHAIMTIDTGSAGSWFLARYTQHGRDCGFGQEGLVEGSVRGSASAVAMQPDGRIVIAGDRQHAFMAARYMGAGTPRTCPHEGVVARKTRYRHPKRAASSARAP